jgi:hypothetical protein
MLTNRVSTEEKFSHIAITISEDTSSKKNWVLPTDSILNRKNQITVTDLQTIGTRDL